MLKIVHHIHMLSNSTQNNATYDQFFLDHTFNSAAMLKFSKSEIEWLLSEINLPKSAKIIDVACGSGRHLKAFAELGYSPSGVDVSPDCVRLAKENCPPLASNIHLESFLDFSSHSKLKYDLVFIAGGSFGYDPSLVVNLDHLKHLLISVEANGYLVLQFLNRSWAEQSFKKRLTFWNENDTWYTLDKRELHENLLKSEKIFLEKNSATQKRYADVIYTFTESEILGFIEEISKQLKLNFTKIKLSDSFSPKEFNEATSATPVLILKRSF